VPGGCGGWHVEPGDESLVRAVYVGGVCLTTTFRGSAVSFGINGNDLVAQKLFAIENAKSSRVNVVVRRLTVL
jgi:hypothetical protein